MTYIKFLMFFKYRRASFTAKQASLQKAYTNALI